MAVSGKALAFTDVGILKLSMAVMRGGDTRHAIEERFFLVRLEASVLSAEGRTKIREIGRRVRPGHRVETKHTTTFPTLWGCQESLALALRAFIKRHLRSARPVLA
jgi:hypothetical protein